MLTPLNLEVVLYAINCTYHLALTWVQLREQNYQPVAHCVSVDVVVKH